MRIQLLNFEGGPGIPLFNFGGGPGVPLLNIRGVPGPILNFEGGSRIPGPRFQGPGVLVPLLHHAHRYDINKPRSRHGHNLSMMMLIRTK